MRCPIIISNFTQQTGNQPHEIPSIPRKRVSTEACTYYKIFQDQFLKSQGAGTVSDGKTDYVGLSKVKIEEFAKQMAQYLEGNSK